MTVDHYETLGVNKNASKAEIKKAYRKRANKTHPDKGGDTETHQALTVAYSVLIDPAKRERYDRGENPTQGSPASKAEQYLIMVFEKLLAEEFKGNLIKEARSRVIQTQVQTSSVIGQQKQKMKAFSGKLGRIKSEGKDNFFESLILQKIQFCQTAIDRGEEELKALREVVDMLGEYSDTRPDGQPAVPPGQITMQHGVISWGTQP